MQAYPVYEIGFPDILPCDTATGLCNQRLLAAGELRGAPEEDERLCIELVALMRRLIQLCCFADLDAVDSKTPHTSQFFLSAPKAVRLSARGLNPARNPPYFWD